MRDGPRPRLIMVRGWNSKSKRLGCFKLGAGGAATVGAVAVGSTACEEDLK